MKKLLVMAAFVAGPILYAQQKPITADDINKAQIIKTEQNKTTPSSDAKAFNLSETNAAGNKKATVKSSEARAEATRKGSSAASLKDAVKN